MPIPSSSKNHTTSNSSHRVRREELYDASSDRHSSPERQLEEDAELRAKLNARLSSLLSLNLDTTPPAAQPENQPPNDQSGPDQDNAGEAEEFEFRLFSTSTAAAPKVVLAAEEADAPFSGPALSQRALSHYIRGELSPHEREQFQRAAVTAQDVVAWAGQRAWGLEVPWRVTRITVTVKGGGQQQGVAAAGPEKKKTKRLGKKSRIMLRKRDKARKEAEDALEKLKSSKEEHLKEKKKRLNREKKLKRRLKEKEKKLAAKGEAGGEGGEVESESEGSDGEE
jgi:hypothetical protein